MKRTALLLVMVMLMLGMDRPPSDVAAAEADTLSVVCFGDSLTGHRPGEDYQGKYLKYSDLLGLMLEARRGVGAVRMINSGWAGDRTTPKPNEGWPGAVGRAAQDIIDHQPDIAVILIGGNNRPEDEAGLKQVEEHVYEIAKAAKDAQIRVLLLLYPPPILPDEADASKGWPLDRANPAIRAAAKRLDLPVIDLGPPMLDAAEQHGPATLTNPIDGVHLTPRGEMVFARAIFAELDRLGWIAP